MSGSSSSPHQERPAASARHGRYRRHGRRSHLRRPPAPPQPLRLRLLPHLAAKEKGPRPLACVNRLWFAMAIPVLWRQPCQMGGDPCLGRLLWNIAPARRNLYAQHVKLGAVRTYRRKPTVPVRMPRCVRVDPKRERQKLEEEAIGMMLAGVDFPKLECLTIRDTAYNRVPQLGSHNVKLVHLKPHIEEDAKRDFCVKGIEPVLGQLPAQFPGLTRIEASSAYPNIVDSLKKFEATGKEPPSPLNSDAPLSGEDGWSSLFHIYRLNSSTRVYRQFGRDL
ncbi:uncharacterized protein PG986_013939 [Apiospora aurea]|uniref:Uncharacterized protein n=1 Tax=Apiospora aurea TaxID=335848 RepID=A0ABR1PWZ3_9PEZI